MLTESQNHGITDMLKTVYPTKTTFCWGYKDTQVLTNMDLFHQIMTKFYRAI